MGKNSRIQKTIQDAKQKTEHFLKTKGKRFCAAMLCASMVLGNAGNLANASNVITLGESRLATPSNAASAATPSNGVELQNFKLKDKELYEALQEAIREGRLAETEFRGGDADEYEEFFAEAGDYYELKLDQNNNKEMALRVFARFEESELLNGDNDDHVIDGSEALMFLLVNQSKQDQKAVITVNEKHTQEISVPVNIEEENWVETTSPVIDLTRERGGETATPSDAVIATPSDSVPEEIIPSEEEIPEAQADQLPGELYGLTSVENGTAIGFITTTEAVGLDKLTLIATNSNAIVRYSMPVEGEEDVVVDVTAKRGALPEGAELRARYLPEDGAEYKEAKDSLDAAVEGYSGMMAMDIGFWLNEEEVEPKPGSEIQVKIRMDANLLPDDVDVGTLKVQHHEETPNGIQVKTVAKAVSVEHKEEDASQEIPTATPSNIEENILMEERMAEPALLSVRSFSNEPVPEDEIISEDIGSDEEVENPAEALMDTVEAELGTLRVVDCNGEAAVVETAFVVDGFSKFTITWESTWFEQRQVTVQYVNESGMELDINPSVNGNNISVNKSFQLSDYIVTSPEFDFQYIILKDSNGNQLLRTENSSDIYGKDVGKWSSQWRLYYRANGMDKGEVPAQSKISLVYKPSKPLPTFQGEDTKKNIKIQLFNYQEGITVTDNFKFGGAGYTGPGGGVTQGLVKNQLGNGYPTLVGNKSLDCLFSRNGKFVRDYHDANYLLQYDGKDSSYFYDSSENFASINENGDFSLYYTARYPDENTPPSEPKFLPYNTIQGEAMQNPGGYQEYALGEADPQYAFGMTIDFDFIMPKDGKINGNNMIFEFQGDDDVWVFIDDVLVLDLGGVHDNYKGSINFQSGNVFVEKVNNTGKKQNRDIAEMFKKAGKTWDASDYKSHSLKFFYLERGRGGSNCAIKFNMPTIPKGTINFQKEIGYKNVKDVSDIDFKFKTFVNYDGTSDKKDYELYTGPYEIYNASDLKNPIDTGTAENGIILLKDDQMARLTSPDIQATSTYYIQEIGATSDKFEVSIDGTRLETIYEDGSKTEEIGVETGKLSVDRNPHVVFKNSVSAKNKFNLRIDKIMSDGSMSNEDFQIKVLLGLEEKKPYTGTYEVWKDGRKVTEKTASEEGILTLQAGQYAIITGLMGGNKITVQEVAYDGYKTPTYEMTGALAGEAIVTDDSISGIAKEGKELGDKPEVKVVVTNYPLPGLTVRKTVSGNLGDRERAFDFIVQAKNSNGEAVSLDGTYEGIVVQDGRFTLKHGQSLVIPKLPYGITCTVTEIISEEEGYKTTVKVDGGTPSGSTTATVENMQSSAVVDFTNTKNISAPTGIFTDNLPYLMMLAMAAIGLVGFSSRRRRVKKSRDDD